MRNFFKTKQLKVYLPLDVDAIFRNLLIRLALVEEELKE